MTATREENAADTAHQAMMDLLEAAIDAHGLGVVLCWMSQICYEKADHIRTNWQDETLANAWDVAGNKVGTAGQKLGKVEFAMKMPGNTP